ncbi:MAG: hypothetical protein COA43_08535 [Robiginitomaculum sp.]|nr:MAG: hypothetical protein COA43_08535 [Robiginitomaculum sp.]
MQKLIFLFLITLILACLMLELRLKQNTVSYKPDIRHETSEKKFEQVPVSSPLIKTDIHIKIKPIEFPSNLLTDDSVFKHIDFMPRFGDTEINGFEIILKSDEYTYEDFGFLTGDIITAIGSKTPTTREEFQQIIVDNIKYQSVIVRINRNNITHYIDLELN